MNRHILIFSLILSLSFTACIGEKEDDYVGVEGSRAIEMSLEGLDDYIEIAMSGDADFQYGNDLGDDFFMIREEDGTSIDISPEGIDASMYLIVESYLLGDGDDEKEDYVFFIALEEEEDNTLYGPFSDKIVWHLNNAGLGYTIK